jgi:transcriptional regulator with XRE-family HTH domain
MQTKHASDLAEFVKRLNWLVQISGTTIQQFCLDMGIDRKTFYGWRSGEYGPTAKTLTRLAHKGIDINWLLTGKTLREARRED